MDSKISQFPVATVIQASDLIPIVRGSQNLVATAGVFSQNLPNLGNKGITKNAPVIASAAPIQLTSTVVTLNSTVGSYTLANGSDGQSLTLVSTGIVTVTPVTAPFTSVAMVNGSTLSLLFVGARWVITASHNCTIT